MTGQRRAKSARAGGKLARRGAAAKGKPAERGPATELGAAEEREPARGELVIELRSDSMLLSQHLPIEVRDRHHRRVELDRRDGGMLEEGLYSVSAVLETGERVTQMVHVGAAHPARVEFRSGGDAAREPGTSRGPLRESPGRAPGLPTGGLAGGRPPRAPGGRFGGSTRRVAERGEQITDDALRLVLLDGLEPALPSPAREASSSPRIDPELAQGSPRLPTGPSARSGAAGPPVAVSAPTESIADRDPIEALRSALQPAGSFPPWLARVPLRMAIASLAPDGWLAVSADLRVSARIDGPLVLQQDRRARPEVEPAAGPSCIAMSWAGEHLVMALPLSDRRPESAMCSLAMERRDDPHRAIRLRVELHQRRRVAGALHGMLESGKIGPAIDLARQASELLAMKYADPIGAAYGGLTLHRFGLLDQRAAWVENLARDFAWLADGRILLAALLSRSAQAADRARGLRLLLALADAPLTVFGEAFSLALSLLRRWPDGELAAERAACLEALRGTIARFEFDGTFSTIRWPRSRDRGGQ